MTTFEDFYAEFPKKKSRADARKAWDQAMKKGFDADEIMSGLRRNLPDLKRKDPQFVKHPASWLRAECWADEPDTLSRPQPRNDGGMADFMMNRRSMNNARTIDADYAPAGYREPSYGALESASGSRRH